MWVEVSICHCLKLRLAHEVRQRKYMRCELPTKHMMQSPAYQIVSDTVPPSRTKHTPGCAHGSQVTDMLT